MANTIPAVQQIARQVLIRLLENLVMPMLIFKDFSKEFAKEGQTIQVKIPPVFDAKDFDRATGIEVQDIFVGTVPVTLNKIADVTVEMSAEELALDIDSQTGLMTLEGMGVAIASKINRACLALYKDIPYHNGVAGTTPDALSDLAAIIKDLNDRNVPLAPRNAVWDSSAHSKLIQIDNLVKVNESGDNIALKNAEIGKIYGLNNYMSQAVATHVAGGATAATTPKVKGEVAAGATTMAIDAVALAGKLLKGDLMVIANVQYVVTEDTLDAAANEIAVVKFYPPAPAAKIANDATITFPDATAGGHTANLAFHPQAFAFVTRPMELPKDKESYYAEFNGIGVRVVSGYDMKYKKTVTSVDVLYGLQSVYKELAEVTLG